MPHIADRTYCMTSDKARLVDENTPEAAFLLKRAGSHISDEDAQRYGLTHLPYVTLRLSRRV
jgi:hypothetical protein